MEGLSFFCNYLGCVALEFGSVVGRIYKYTYVWGGW